VLTVPFPSSGGIFLLLEFAELDLDKMLKTQQIRNKNLLAAGTPLNRLFQLPHMIGIKPRFVAAAQEGGPLAPSNLLPSLVCLNTVRLVWQQMLEAVHTIHEERVVHGDLKPANFVCIQGRLKLIDFGIAKAISNDTTNIVRDSQIGTINYISPEALIGDSSIQGAKYKVGPSPLAVLVWYYHHHHHLTPLELASSVVLRISGRSGASCTKWSMAALPLPSTTTCSARRR
jgi:serine/threonine protein kinase